MMIDQLSMTIDRWSWAMGLMTQVDNRPYGLLSNGPRELCSLHLGSG